MENHVCMLVGHSGQYTVKSDTDNATTKKISMIIFNFVGLKNSFQFIWY